jgi:2-phosphosulfolactate phosphatase
VRRASGLPAAASARGAVVVIDVLRAFTTAAYACASGAREIVLVASVEEAFALRVSRLPEALLIGEVDGRPIPGFDHGNSPERMRELDLAGRTVILRSSSGTQGVVCAERASSVWLGSLVTASATARALEHEREVTLLAMGWPDGRPGEEDEACAELFEQILRGREPDTRAITLAVEQSVAGRQALNPAIDWISPGDLACATWIDRFDFALPVAIEDGLMVARPRART